MIVGFNHNISYKGVGFHVQTEDSGVKSPQLVTLLYHAGTIIASKKTVYADILKVENLSQVVEDLAKEQHKGMLRRLTQGEFDDRIIALKIPIEGAPPAKSEQAPEVETTPPQPEAIEEAEIVAPVEEPPAAGIIAPPEEDLSAVEPQAEPSDPEKFLDEPLVDKLRQSKQKVRREPTLDDLIYAYLTGADKC
ncbi:hypothetical protein SAMN02745165_01622 [Malonomonas rubra DSM 5091]|uniref:Uncharacterized protein n=1 Tax=Malonomonas rubra DSM 5091 TaxID=1122189 RepID=A0A1M6GPH9_MALRU|nr:hypothetical protein [Malonomonas rubra]SHJ11844.1 hypothetical protein SAMN02745165_01622 [Malonomonas rubra DSM 5091]